MVPSFQFFTHIIMIRQAVVNCGVLQIRRFSLPANFYLATAAAVCHNRLDILDGRRRQHPIEDFTHFNAQGRAKMVDVGEKPPTRRTASAGARVFVNRDTLVRIRDGGMKKGDVLAVAQVAGIMGAKRTAELIPMCHPVQVEGIDLALTLDEARCCVDIRAEVRCGGRTGVEMEALTAASTAALTVYDMCKAIQRDIIISDIRLLEKTGGIHGDFVREEH